MTQFMNIPNSKIVERLLSLELDTTKLHSTINGFSTRSKGRGESIIESIKYVLQNRKQGARNLMQLLDLNVRKFYMHVWVVSYTNKNLYL